MKSWAKTHDLAAVDGAVAGDHAVAVRAVAAPGRSWSSGAGPARPARRTSPRRAAARSARGRSSCPGRAASRRPAPSRRGRPRRRVAPGPRACPRWCGCRCPCGTSVPPMDWVSALGHGRQPSLAVVRRDAWTVRPLGERCVTPGAPWGSVEVFDRLGSTNAEVGAARPDALARGGRRPAERRPRPPRPRRGRRRRRAPLAVSVAAARCRRPAPGAGCRCSPGGLHRAVEEVAGVRDRAEVAQRRARRRCRRSAGCSASGHGGSGRPAVVVASRRDPVVAGAGVNVDQRATTCRSTPPPRCGCAGRRRRREDLLTAYLAPSRVLHRAWTPGGRVAQLRRVRRRLRRPSARRSRCTSRAAPSPGVATGPSTMRADWSLDGTAGARRATPPATWSTSGPSDGGPVMPRAPTPACPRSVGRSRPRPRPPPTPRRARRVAGTVPPTLLAARAPTPSTTSPARCSASRPRWGGGSVQRRRRGQPAHRPAVLARAGLPERRRRGRHVHRGRPEALRPVARIIARGGHRGDDRAGDDPRLRPHHRPAGGLADPARWRSRWPTCRRSTRGPGFSSDGLVGHQPLRAGPATARGGGAASRRSPTGSSRCWSTSGVATSPPPSRACSRMPTPRCTTTPASSGSSGSPTWCPSPRFVRRMTERQLARLVQRFEPLATDVITAHGGRVIKTVGDEVLFVTIGGRAGIRHRPGPGRRHGRGRLLPHVRVGLAHGQVVSRLGDVFGMTVNRASRITAVTRSGTVLVDDALRGVAGQPLRLRDEPAAAADAARHRAGDPARAAPRQQAAPTRHGRRWGHPLR